MVETANKTGVKVSVPKIFAAIAAIQAGVGSIPKNGTGPTSQGGYKYVKNDDIIEAISKLMIENNVITRPEITRHGFVTREIGSNRSVAVTVIDLKVTYISTVDGSEFIVRVSAEGADNSDKGTRKAVTQAQKIANLLTFNIATGEPDPDGTDVVPTVSNTPTQQRIAKANTSGANAIYNEIKAFLGTAGLTGSVANTIGQRISGGKASEEWLKDDVVLAEVLKALKNGEIE